MNAHIQLAFEIMTSVHIPCVWCVLLFHVVAALQHGSRAQTKGPSDAVETAADFLLDAKLQAQQMDDLTKEVESLAQDVGAGGENARCKLFGLPFQDACHHVFYHLRDMHLLVS